MSAGPPQLAKRGAALALASLVYAMALALCQPVLAGSIEHEDRVEMTAATHAAITPDHAIRIAENGGGRAYGYGMEATQNGHWYEVDVLRDGAKLAVRIDPATGKVLGSSAAKGEDAEGANAVDRSKLAFHEAISRPKRSVAVRRWKPAPPAAGKPHT